MPKLTNSIPPKAFASIFYILIASTLLLAIFGGYTTYTRYAQGGVFGNGAYDASKNVAEFNGRAVAVPAENASYDLAVENTASDVLGSKSKKTGTKRIEIDLTTQKLYAYEGSKKVMSFLVSTGKWNLTPTGSFTIWTKLKYTTMAGGSKANNTYYYLPNVPFTMYFYKDYGIHGAYWHNNFGHPMSHGCINMKPEEAEKLFYWANPVISGTANSVRTTKDNAGTKVIIYGTTPRE